MRRLLAQRLQLTLGAYTTWKKSKGNSTRGRESLVYTHFYTAGLATALHEVMEVFPRMLRQYDCTQPHDCFFWCAFRSNLEMARVVWPLCQKPVHVALLGSAISQACARHANNVESAATARAQAATLEGWAVGAIETAPTRQFAQEVLSMSIVQGSSHNALEIAMRCEAKQFLSKQLVQDLIDLMWRGGSVFGDSLVTLAPEFSWTFLVLKVFFPFLVSEVRHSEMEPAERIGEDMRLRTLLYAQKVGYDERQKIASKVELHAHHPAGDGNKPKKAAKPAVVVKAHAAHRRHSSLCRGVLSRFRQEFGTLNSGVLQKLKRKSTWRVSTTSGARGTARSADTPSHPWRRACARTVDMPSALVQRCGDALLPRARRRVLASFYAVPAVRFVSHAIVHSLLFAFQILMIFRFKTPTDLDVDKPTLPLLSRDPVEIMWDTMEFLQMIDGVWHL